MNSIEATTHGVAQINAETRQVIICPGTSDFETNFSHLLLSMQQFDEDAPSGWTIKVQVPKTTNIVTTTSVEPINPIYHFQGE